MAIAEYPRRPGRPRTRPVFTERGLCGCGCGQQVNTPGVRFLRGHNVRTPQFQQQLARIVASDEWRAKINEQRDGDWRVCPNCRERVWVKRSELTGWRACSRTCLWATRRTLVPWNGLQTLVLGRIAETDQGFDAFARSAGVNEETLRKWFRNKPTARARGRALHSNTVAALATVLGISYEDALGQAGTDGMTGEDRERENGRRLGTSMDAEKRTEVARLGGLAMKGSTHTMAEATREKLRSHPKVLESNAAFTAMQKDRRGRIVSVLNGRLRHTPQPSRSQQREWARVVGHRLKETVEVILSYWDPLLRRRGLIGAGGRPPSDLVAERNRYTEELYEAWPKTAGGKLARTPDSLLTPWDILANQVNERFGTDFSGPALYEDRRRHRRGQPPPSQK